MAREADGLLFRWVRAPGAGALASACTPGSVYADVVVGYMSQVSITGDNMGPHALRLVGDLIEKIPDIGHHKITLF